MARPAEQPLGDQTFKAGLDRLPIGVTLFDAALELVFWNEAVTRLYELPQNFLKPGLSYEGLIRFQAERGDFGPGEAGEQVRERLGRIGHGRPQCCEKRLPGGSILEIRVIPLANGGLITTYTDITALRRAEAARDESETRYQELAHHAPVLICVHSEGIIRYLNAAGARMLAAATPDQLIGHRIDAVVHPDHHEDLRRPLGKYDRRTGALPQMEHRYIRRDGSTLDVSVSVRPFRQNGAIAFLTVAQDITESKRAEEQLRAILDASPVGAAIADPDTGRIRFTNPAFLRLVRCEDGPPPEQLAALLPSRHTFNRLRAQLQATGEIRDLEQRICPRDSEPFWSLLTIRRLPLGSETALFIWLYDISELKAGQEKLHHLAHYDELTGLPNRRMFLDQLRRTVALGKRLGTPAALLYLDLDGFKTINDTLGHDAGDEALRTLARRLGETLRSSDMIARLGGDEFGGIFMDIHDREDAASIAAKVMGALEQPIPLGGERLAVSASIGIALFPHDGEEMDALLAKADCAMYTAKRAGKGTVRFCSAVRATASDD